MKLAIMSDIHGNYIALQSCLEHAFMNCGVNIPVFS